ncbi:DUF5694 domain-containing protein [Robiginitalea aurantiaca]|uniref:DUF5694 domain-containing protein n=1 Tax=Robiginitalea aurantiaca TaxID=3056915 RepID=A0ABT7WDE8_9FLAO|nr:DUF5694 domain-containing protein [Robiginitalea aurantiaca]MDM9630923.1 DUF5694 domain-containing protein [Robiginitalea aurantiaca]
MIYQISRMVLWTLVFGLFASCSQRPTSKEEMKIAPASSYFPKERAQVLVLGTFHFNYPGLDAMKASEEDKIDVLEEPKKSEVTDLINYLKAYKPTKIALEAHPDWGAVRKFREYQKGGHRDKRDERYQIGMRMADELGLDTLYSIDAEALIEDLIEVTDSTYLEDLGEGYDFRSDSPYDSLMTEWYMADTRMISKVPLLDYMKHINNRESHEYGYGAYLIGDFKLGEYRGADLLSIYWYNRNLRIFRNLQRISEGPQDRILIVIGNGHAAILRQLIEMSPEFDFVELDSL